MNIAASPNNIIYLSSANKRRNSQQSYVHSVYRFLNPTQLHPNQTFFSYTPDYFSLFTAAPTRPVTPAANPNTHTHSLSYLQFRCRADAQRLMNYALPGKRQRSSSSIPCKLRTRRASKIQERALERERESWENREREKCTRMKNRDDRSRGIREEKERWRVLSRTGEFIDA